jgi:uncharacterized membrane protein
MFVTLVPLPTELLAAYIGQPKDAVTAAVVYNGFFTLIAVAYNLLWWHLRSHPELLTMQTSNHYLRTITVRYMFGPLSYLIAVALAFVYVPLSLAMNLALAIFYALPQPHPPEYE